MNRDRANVRRHTTIILTIVALILVASPMAALAQGRVAARPSLADRGPVGNAPEAPAQEPSVDVASSVVLKEGLAAGSQERFGVATNRNTYDYADWSDLDAGWYHNWGARPWDNKPMEGVQFYPMVGAWGDLWGTPHPGTLASLVQDCPTCYPDGTIWIVGNELDIDRFSTANGQALPASRLITPQEYAVKYKNYYDAIKAINPSYRVAMGCLISSYTFMYDARAEYQRLYGEKMPIDVYTMHGYMNTTNVDILVQVKFHVNKLREMMKEFGDQDKWLIITETGALYDAGTEVINGYMDTAFDYLATATSEEYGCPNDNNLMVQRWAWFALTSWAPGNDHQWEGTDLFDIDNKEITPVGENFTFYPKSPPALPSSYYGSVTLDGDPAPAGTEISAWIDGVMVAQTSVSVYNGGSVYVVDIPQDNAETTSRDGGAEGDGVRFKLGSAWVANDGTWSSGSVSEVNLAATSSRDRSDYDGDGRMDLFTWTPTTGYWNGVISTRDYDRSPGESILHQWGSPGDIPLMCDMDNDGKTDLFVWRPSSGYWFGLLSSKNWSRSYGDRYAVQWGSPSDVPFLGDIDGDGIDDLFVWRPSTGYWYGLLSSKGYSRTYQDRFAVQWGLPSDIPMLADMDGDGIDDLMVWRPSTGYWYGLLSTRNYGRSYADRFARQWGMTGDVPLLGDVDGDGEDDLFVWRPGNGYWYGLLSSRNYDRSAGRYFQLQWGTQEDTPKLGDIDGDGKDDIVTWRATIGQWNGLLSSKSYDRSFTNRFSLQWGSFGDMIVR